MVCVAMVSGWAKLVKRSQRVPAIVLACSMLILEYLQSSEVPTSSVILTTRREPQCRQVFPCVSFPGLQRASRLYKYS